MHSTVLLYAGGLVQFQKPSQPIATYVRSNLNASNRQIPLGNLSHIISKLSTTELAPFPFYPVHHLIDLEIIPRFLLV